MAVVNLRRLHHWALDPREIAQRWITNLGIPLKNPKHELTKLAELFHEDSWWRDMLTLDWGFHAIHKLPEIQRQVGRGTGVLRLTQNEAGVWKAYSIYTTQQELDDFEEPLGLRRAEETIETMSGGLRKGNWIERRQKQVEFQDEEPAELLVGAGQAGLNIAARLQSRGVSCLVVDRNKRIGDSWRTRYRTLVTQEPVEYTHMAYLPFPRNWPQDNPKDKLADWFEAYASIMTLNVWLPTSVNSASDDDAKAQWTVTLARGADASERVLHPRHIVWCTSHSGEPKIPTFPSQDSFKGTVYHSSQHHDAGHDIAQNFYENGAEVTMLQRSGTYVTTSEQGVLMAHEGLARGERVRDRPHTLFLDGLTAAGFALDAGVEGSGLFRTFITKAAEAGLA
ncbi:putative flavin-binding monooxygenase [Aspergillus clavatus NRRL 1]|uniref:Uncharacterized protein n=1 Tax=Aspergillus clavatus (strain ATCC 1007 / CBS 513.65 / DSM 816 / NCTC 3887 / NRRL 1 / QM 1276 / 107) TaxID=344612 RepID=A1CPW3_ASPCL|nr:uncharacterized protein ACLA_023990 [Aspergillus clavatus NRRL 1]EAW07684.1 hypothetical protein ACLA_023990 [Aspergillus clavatus NRRL 1]